ncbi:hypothetical protein AAGS40_23150 [Paraburkholderia sp. PREW-6R]|uniref:hypothetical protein n=1 Tax=Paraburkholderia sp. PREW-6R TaxID=3141544 RepID=UPI0031F4F173
MSEADKHAAIKEAFQREEMKVVFRESLDAWLDKQFAQFGKWTLGALLAAAFAGCVYLALVGQGWIHK